MTAEETLFGILVSAADSANGDARVPDDLKLRGEIFQARPVAPQGPLSLAIEESAIAYLRSLGTYEREMPTLRLIARDAVETAIVKEGRTFVGVMIGLARKGESLFDRFA